jgi:hypothetical protein
VPTTSPSDGTGAGSLGSVHPTRARVGPSASRAELSVPGLRMDPTCPTLTDKRPKSSEGLKHASLATPESPLEDRSRSPEACCCPCTEKEARKRGRTVSAGRCGHRSSFVTGLGFDESPAFSPSCRAA